MILILLNVSHVPSTLVNIDYAFKIDFILTTINIKKFPRFSTLCFLSRRTRVLCCVLHFMLHLGLLIVFENDSFF